MSTNQGGAPTSSSPPSADGFYLRAVQAAVQQVATSLDEAVAFDTLAKQAGVSPFHFHRIFRGLVGETPLQLHRRLRLERAAYTLLTSAQPITSIAFDAGYETHEAFTRAFSRRFASSPQAFRTHNTAQRPGCAPPSHTELAALSGVHFTPTLDDEGDPTALVIQFVQGEPMDVSITEQPELRVATVRHVGPYSEIGAAFGRLGQLAGQHGLFGAHSAMVGLYHDVPEQVPAAELRADAGLVVGADVTLPESLGEATLPAGRYARYVHRGAYRELGDVWARLMGPWLSKSGEQLADGVSYEIYRNQAGEVPDEELITELYVPLA